MFRKVFAGFAFLALFSSQPVSAKKISISQAKETALRFMENGGIRRAPGAVATKELSYCATTATPYYYVFNKGENDGYIIVSADDATVPVIGFSDSGNFDYDNMPDAMKWMLSSYEKQIKANYSNTGANSSDAAGYSSVRRRVLSRNTAEWSQEEPFNYLIPGRKLVGCVGVAMATIMQYYNYPAAGKGSLDGNDFNHTYDWTNMRTDNYRSGYTTAQGDAVARLVADAALSIQTNFSMSGSSASEVRVPAALVNYFGYDAGVSYKKKSEMSQKAWEELIISEIDAGRPVLYSGQDISVGHAFVCDGYEMRGSQPYFRMNWGWGGIGNDVFIVSSLTPTTQSGNRWNFSEQATIIYNIKPAENSIAWSTIQLTSDEKQIGMSSDKETVGAGETFTVRAGAFKNVSYDNFSGKIAVAMFASDGAFKTLVSPEYNYGLSAFQIDRTLYRDFNCTVPAGTTVAAGDVFRMATKATGENEWKPITGGSLTTNAIEAIGNHIDYFTVSKPASVNGATLEGAADRVIKGRKYVFRVIPDNTDDVVTVKANGYILTQGSDFTYTLPNVIENMTLDIYVQNVADVKRSKTVWVSSGMLEKALTEEECGTVKSLTLFGTMDVRDFDFIREKMRVDSLDLSGVSITANGTNAANTIPTRAFRACGTLKAIKLPAGVTRLGNRAFELTGLREVEIPASVSTWDYNVFLGCANLSKVISRRRSPAFINWCVFSGTPRTQLIVPTGSAALYQAKENWKDFKNVIEEDAAPATSYKVIMQDANGVKITTLDGSSSEMAPGGKYRFTVETDGSHGDDRMTVYANTGQLTAVNGVYEATINANTLIHIDFTEPAANAGVSPWKITSSKGGVGMVTDVINVMPGKAFTIRVNALDIPSGDSFKSGIAYAAVLTDKDGRIKEVISPVVTNPYTNTGVLPATFNCCVKESNVNEGNLIRIATSSNMKAWSLVEGTDASVKTAVPAIGNEVIYHTVKMPSNLEKVIITDAVTQVVHGGDITFSVNAKLSTDLVSVSVNDKDYIVGKQSATVQIPNVKEDLDVTISAYDQNEKPYKTYNIYAGQLAEKITEAPMNQNIRLVGKMNAKDFEVIKTYTDNITALDLSDVEIVGDGNKANSLPTQAFASMTKMSKITKIILPKSLKRIETSAFYRVSNLTEITIPENVEYIGMSAFTYCSKLNKVISLSANPIPLTNGDPFPGMSGMTKNMTLEIPKGSKSKYQALSYWNLFKTINEIAPTHTVTYDPERAEPYNIKTNTDKVEEGKAISMKVKVHPIYNDSHPIKPNQKYKVYLNGTQTDGDFLAKDYNMWSVTVNSDVRFDVAYFYDAEVTAPENITVAAVDGYRLKDIKEGDLLKFTVTKPENEKLTVKVRVNGDEMPADESGIYTVENIQANVAVDVAVVPVNGATLTNEDLKTIATDEVADITDVKLDGEISDETFATIRDNFEGLENIDLSGIENTTIPDNALTGLTNLVNVDIPETVTTIGENAFAGCSNLETITLSNVSEIGNGAFSGCDNLTSVIINTQGQDVTTRRVAGRANAPTVPGINTGSFTGANPNCLVFVMDGVAAGENIIANKGGEVGYVATADVRMNASYAFSTPNKFAMDGNKVILERDFGASDKWNGITLPFSMNEEEIKSVFGEKTLVASLDTLSGNTLFFDVETKAMAANKPYLIRVSDIKDSYTLTAGEVLPAQAEMMDTRLGVEFVGTYSPVTLQEGEYYIADNALNEAGENPTEAFTGYFRMQAGGEAYNLCPGYAKTVFAESGFATFSSDRAVNVPQGVTVYTSEISEDKIIIRPIDVKVIPANTGVIIGGSGEVGFSVATEEGSVIQTVLTAAPAGYVSDGNIYGLRKDAGVFAKVEAGTSLAKHTAYLRLADSEAKAIRVVIGGETTDIDSIRETIMSGNDSVYDMNGRRLPTLHKGINIVNGKKIIIK